MGTRLNRNFTGRFCRTSSLSLWSVWIGGRDGGREAIQRQTVEVSQRHKGENHK